MMNNARLALVGTILAGLLSGCGESESTPVPAKPADNPHLDQMKAEMLKNMKIKTLPKSRAK